MRVQDQAVGGTEQLKKGEPLRDHLQNPTLFRAFIGIGGLAESKDRDDLVLGARSRPVTCSRKYPVDLACSPMQR